MRDGVATMFTAIAYELWSLPDDVLPSFAVNSANEAVQNTVFSMAASIISCSSPVTLKSSPVEVDEHGSHLEHKKAATNSGDM